MSDDQTKQPVTISRDELYAHVWTTPMSRLGEQYGISGNGLAKICLRLDVPYPLRGYWARKAAGKKVLQTSLPAIRQGDAGAGDDHTEYAGTPPPQLSKELEDALAAARRLSDLRFRKPPDCQQDICGRTLKCKNC